MPGVFSIFQKVSMAGPFPHLNKVTNRNLLQRVWPATVRFKSEGIYDDAYQYLQTSKVPTSHFQESLPHLPVPKLDETCERYIRAQHPLADHDSYQKTKKHVNDFLNHDGPRCQQILVEEDKNSKNTSYISQPWFDMYLSDRNPLPINYNPFLVFVRNCDELYNSQLVRASNLVVSSLRFYKSLHEEFLEPEVYHLNPGRSKNLAFKTFTGLLPKSVSWYGAYLFKAFPLDMSQYKSLFNTTRIPSIGKDYIKHVHGKKHITVMKGGHFYVFDVIDDNGYIVSPDLIFSSIKHLVLSQEPAAEYPVGVLTTENRDIWAAARKHLETLGNSEVLELIDTSLFNLVLDQEKPGKDPVKLIRLYLHADGLNRWFDKSFSLIVTKDGHAGINFEHSWGDGVAVLRYFNDIHTDSSTKPKVHYNTVGTEAISVRKLEFNLDDKMKSSIAEAKRKYETTCSSLEVRVLDYQKFGRQICKPLNISPDAMMQLAFQMAYDKLCGKQVATYESCSTAAFKHGRTETVRPCTSETKEVCLALRCEPHPSKSELQNLIVNCSKFHSQLIKEAAMGLGFDRHLFALKLKCEEMGLKPDIFSDPAYSAMNHNILSTSTLASDSLLLGAFGPVVPDGFGVGYSLWKNRLGSIVTNYKQRSDGEDFVQALEQSLDTIETILK